MTTIRKRVWETTTGIRRIAWVVNFVDRDGNRGRKQFPKKSDADAFRVELETNLRKGMTALSLRSPFEEIADAYLKHCAGRVEGGSMTRHNYVVYEGHVKNYIVPDTDRHKNGRLPSRMKKITHGMSRLKAGEVSRSDVTKFRDALKEAGVSVQTTRKILGTLQQICGYAMEQGLMTMNPAEGIRVVGRRDERYKKVVIPSIDSVRRVLDAAHPEMQRRLLFAAATGVRAGEMHAVTWGQIDLQRGFVLIDRRIDVYGKVEVTKTPAGMRDIPLGRMLVHELTEWKKLFRPSSPDDLVFPDTDGDAIRHDVMIKRWYNPIFRDLKNAYKEDPIRTLPCPPRFRWHDLRHFAISSWIAAGLSPKAVQTFAGHSSLQVTMDRYGHLFPDDEHRDAMGRVELRLWSK